MPRNEATMAEEEEEEEEEEECVRDGRDGVSRRKCN